MPRPPAIVTCGCDRPHYARGMCSRHYNRWSRAKRNRKCSSPPRQYNPRRGCEEFGCNAAHHALGLCASHYWLKVKRVHPPPPARQYYRNPLVPQIEELARTMKQHQIAKLLKVSRNLVIGVVDRARKMGRLPDPKVKPYVPPRDIFPPPGTCLWPMEMDDDWQKPTEHFCGDPVFIYGSPYCATHAARVYVRRPVSTPFPEQTHALEAAEAAD